MQILWINYQLPKYLFTKDMTESLQNKKKMTKVPKIQAGWDEKHVYFLTWPYSIVLITPMHIKTDIIQWLGLSALCNNGI